MPIQQQDPQTILEWELVRKSWHEAGHAVIAAVLNFPLHHATLRIKTSLLGRAKQVQGRVHHWPPNTNASCADEEIDAYLTVAMAGMEAEALFVHGHTGTPLRRARIEATRRSRGDMDDIHRALHSATQFGARFQLRSLQAIEAAAQQIVSPHMPAIGRVAEALYRKRHLTAQQIRRLAA